MRVMTLRELCEASGTTRRAIQGYEARGLVRPSGKTKRGYLIYDEDAQNRVKQIRFLQRAGFELSRIEQIIDAPGEMLKEELIQQIHILQKEQGRLDDVIEEIYAHIKHIEEEN